MLPLRFLLTPRGALDALSTFGSVNAACDYVSSATIVTRKVITHILIVPACSIVIRVEDDETLIRAVHVRPDPEADRQTMQTVHKEVQPVNDGNPPFHIEVYK